MATTFQRLMAGMALARWASLESLTLRHCSVRRPQGRQHPQPRRRDPAHEEQFRLTMQGGKRHCSTAGGSAAAVGQLGWQLGRSAPPSQIQVLQVQHTASFSCTALAVDCSCPVPSGPAFAHRIPGLGDRSQPRAARRRTHELSPPARGRCPRRRWLRAGEKTSVERAVVPRGKRAQRAASSAPRANTGRTRTVSVWRTTDLSRQSCECVFRRS